MEATGGGTGGAESEARRGPGRHGVPGGGTGAVADQGATRRRGYRQAPPAVGWPLHCDGQPEPQRLSLPRKMRCSPTVNVDRLKPFHSQAGAAPAPGNVSDAGQEGEHEVELLLSRREIRGVTRYLVRWRGHTSADDEWLRAEDLTHCQEKVSEYDTAAPRRHAAPRSEHAAPPVVAPAPAGGAPRIPRRFPARGSVGGSGGLCPCRQGGALPLAGGGLGQRYGDRSQPCRRLLARGAVLPHLRPRGGGGAFAPRRGLARPCGPLGSPSACGALVSGRKPTVAGCNGPIWLVVKRVMTSTVRIESGEQVNLRIQREKKEEF
jgi:hypothetical protein